MVNKVVRILQSQTTWTCTAFAIVMASSIPITPLHFGDAKGTELNIGWHEVVRQTTPVSCGPALLAGMKLSLGALPTSEYLTIDIAEMTHTGISLAEFKRISEDFGWHGSWFFGSSADLIAAPKPVPIHLTRPNNHFVLVVYIDNELAIVRDPQFGNIALPTGALMSRWSRYFYF